MLTKELKNKLMNLLECRSDSDIEDFFDEYNNLTDSQQKEVWEFVAVYNAPDLCKDCKNVLNYRFNMPCLYCIRSKLNLYKDYYEKKN